MNGRTMTRPATPAEKAAARAAGLPVPSVVEVVMTTAAEQHAARLGAPRKSPKPAGMSTSDYYGRRARASYGVDEVEEQDEGVGFIA